ncbi:hypothetical protein SAMN04488245_102369 [Alloyangia pacifica]|uniref:Uncharacterized protein n=2 Tax=Alloyangia pacifica TaxID=311180 RepID=A0A1I6PNU2_9RHOB|nr:hypothetical protein SAMN04488245_102369 [Alloyangia pacifica]SFS41887.1 hypothetical protein SAMN04488050_101670 [Alloyangia pacifica]
MAAQTQSQWFAISQKIIQEGNAKNTPPDIKSLSTASSRAEAAGRNYRSAIEALGLKGAEFGAVRAQKVNAVAGVISGEEEWDDV